MNVEFFVENVKFHCRAKGVSPSRACIESGAGKTLMDNVKRGRVPSIDSVQLLAQYLGITVSELLGEHISAAPAIPAPSHVASLVARSYDQADEGTQAAVRKLLDIDEVPQRSGRAKQAM